MHHPSRGLAPILAPFILAFIAACSGGGGSGGSSSSSSGSSSNSGSSSSGSSCSSGSSSGSSSSSGGTAAFSNFPDDFVIPYFSGPSAINLAAASNPTVAVTVANGNFPLTAVVEAGEYSAGKLFNSRPAYLAYFQNKHWYSVDLRNGTGVSPVAFSGESQQGCDNFVELIAMDYTNAKQSTVFYQTAGPDGICDNGDDELHAVRLGDSTSTAPTVLGSIDAAAPIRQIYNSDGSLNGFVLWVGGELRYYDSGLANFKTLLGNVGYALRAGSFVYTDSVYVAYQDGSNTEYVVRVDAGGTVSAPLFSAANSLPAGGVSDTDALYVVVRTPPSGVHQESIVRIPYASGQAASTIVPGQAGESLFLNGVTANKVVYNELGGSGYQLIAVGKDGTGAAVIASSAYQPFTAPGTFITSDGRIAWTSIDTIDHNGYPTATSAGIDDENGNAVEHHSSSEWISPIYGAHDFSSQTYLPVLGGVLVRSYTGNYNTDGDKGGTIAYYDFTTGKSVDVATVPDQALLIAGYEEGISPLIYATPGPVSTSDLALVNLRDNTFTRMTQTPGVNEGLP